MADIELLKTNINQMMDKGASMDDFIDLQEVMEVPFDEFQTILQSEIDRRKAIQQQTSEAQQIEFSSAPQGIPDPEVQEKVIQEEKQNQKGINLFQKVFGRGPGGVTPEMAGALVKEAKETTPEQRRMALEAGMGVAATIPIPGFRLGAIALRSALAGVGAFAGSEIAETFDPTEEPHMTALRAAKGAAIGEAAGGIALKGIAAPLKAMGVGMPGAVKPGAKRAQLILQSGDETLTLGQAIDHPITDTIHNLAEASPLGTRITARTEGSARNFLTQKADEFVDSFDIFASQRDFAEVAQNSINQGSKAFKAQAEGLYRKVDRLTNPQVYTERVTTTSFNPGNLIDENGDLIDYYYSITKPLSKKIVKKIEAVS